MSKRLPEIIACGEGAGVRMRCAQTAGDRELLRRWKNENRRFFFHQEEIAPAQQESWFAGYLLRSDDHQYLVEEEHGSEFLPVGVLGCRLLGEVVDVYNVMRGQRLAGGQAKMGECLRLLCGLAERTYGRPVTCKVLLNNPAIGWYEQNGFRVVERRPDHVLMRYREGSSRAP